MPFISKKNLDVQAATISALRDLTNGQKQLIEELNITRTAAMKEAAELKARLERLRDLLTSIGLEPSEVEDGTALLTTPAAKLLSVQLVDQPDQVSALLGEDTSEKFKIQATMCAKRLLRPTVQ